MMNFVKILKAIVCVGQYCWSYHNTTYDVNWHVSTEVLFIYYDINMKLKKEANIKNLFVDENIHNRTPFQCDQWCDKILSASHPWLHVALEKVLPEWMPGNESVWPAREVTQCVGDIMSTITRTSAIQSRCDQVKRHCQWGPGTIDIYDLDWYNECQPHWFN